MGLGEAGVQGRCGVIGGGRRVGGAHRVGILDHSSLLVLDVSVLVLFRSVAVPSLLRFSHGLPGAMILAVIFEVEVSVMRWRLPSCLRNGVVRLDVGEFGGIWCLTWLVKGVESEIGFVGGCCEGAGPFGGWVLVFGGYGVGGVRSRGPPGVWIRVLLLFSPGQSICKSLVRGWGAYRGSKASP